MDHDLNILAQGVQVSVQALHRETREAAAYE